MNILDGKKIALEIQSEIKKKVSSIQGRKPTLAFILVGDNPASVTYVKAKQKASAHIGIVSHLINLPITTNQDFLLKTIHNLNSDSEIDGILVQLPLPLHIDDKAIMRAIDPNKDVDGFHPINMGKLLLGEISGFCPCTPLGIQELLIRSKVEITGKHVVILGRSNIVGKPLAALLCQKKEHCDATVTICHSKSHNLETITKSADILVAAIGQPLFVKEHMVKEDACVIDVGINRVPIGLVGDVDFSKVAPKCSFITPVPGGVGPMTIAMLMKNTLLSYERKNFSN